MAKFCLTKELADQLKQAAIKGEIDIAKMYEMTSSQRRALFEKWVDKNTAKQINAGFENAMISDQQNALKRWADGVFGKKEVNKAKKKDVFDKIDRLKDLGVLTPENSEAFLSDLVSTKIGVTVTAEEAAVIAKKAQKIQQEAQKFNEFGLPTLEYFKAKKNMENYLESRVPTGKLKVVTGTIGRATMLFSLKSPLLNIESNTIQGFLASAERRVRTRKVQGLNNDFAKKYQNYVTKVFKETGYDVSRMRSLQGPQKIVGEEVTTTQGPGNIRKVGRFYEDIVFNKLMGLPDVIFSAFHFADSANLASTKLAQGEGLKGNALKQKALEIFKDATSINPATPQGKAVREQAIADAEFATYTNKTRASDVALGIRTVLNVASGDLRLGDQLMPFVKTPANVIQAGIDYSGVFLPVETLQKTAKVIQSIRDGETLSEAVLNNFTGYSVKLFRAGLGMTLAYIIAGLFEPDDFIGEFPVSAKEQELLKLQNATTNSVRIGDKWISLDYFGPIGTPLVAMLYAKKYGENSANAMYSYYVGAGRQLAKLPGVEIGANIFDTLSRTKFEGIDAVTGEIKKGAVDFVRARTIPAFIYDIAKASDRYEREVKKEKPLQAFQAAVPGLRKKLPAKIDVFGQPIKTESELSVLLFGSRVKSAINDPVLKELERLAETDNLPSITNYAKTSDRMKALKEQLGDEKFREAEIYLGSELKRRYTLKIKSKSYKRATDEKKADMLNDIKKEVLEKTLRKYKFKRKLLKTR